MRYEGHKTKHTRRHDHGRPGTPHTAWHIRQTGSVPQCQAPRPPRPLRRGAWGRSVRLMNEKGPAPVSGPSDSQPLLNYPAHPKAQAGCLSKPGSSGFLGHARCGAGLVYAHALPAGPSNSGQRPPLASRGTITMRPRPRHGITPHLTTGAYGAAPGGPSRGRIGRELCRSCPPECSCVRCRC